MRLTSIESSSSMWHLPRLSQERTQGRPKCALGWLQKLTYVPMAIAILLDVCIALPCSAVLINDIGTRLKNCRLRLYLLMLKVATSHLISCYVAVYLLSNTFANVSSFTSFLATSILSLPPSWRHRVSLDSYISDLNSRGNGHWRCLTVSTSNSRRTYQWRGHAYYWYH